MLIAAPLAAADAPLFPVPLHFIRTIEDPISGALTRVDEYCVGSRIVTVAGSRTAIADYATDQVIDIDREARVYSVSRFDEIAGARAIANSAPHTKETWTTTPLGVKAAVGERSVDAFEIVSNGPEKVTVEVRVARDLTVSRRAFEALLGSAYPNVATEQQNAIARACARMRSISGELSGSDSYGVPLEQSTTFQAGSEKPVTIRNSIVSVSNDVPPADVLAIPAGAKLVESRVARMRKSLEELKDLPLHP